ncbi:MAG: diaminopimelate epimerase [Bacteroidetes bacterium]|nr:MAG: diaminopimelate epimerase [Bacteroidota bacterium]
MTIKFYKYHGAGNDFVIIDNRITHYQLSTKQIALLCHRRFGIGADGFMTIENDEKLDFRMKYYNSDGAEGSMCGNGGRCIVAFAKKLEIISNITTFIATDGIHEAKINSNNGNILDISLKMNDVDNISTNNDSYFLDTGSPHHISFVNDVDTIDVYNKGKEIRYSDFYKKTNGTNVNFIEIKDDYLKIRTYERGVEDETYACGTGATAAAIAYAYKEGIYNKEIRIKAIGGDLSLSFNFIKDENMFKDVVLRGPAEIVFSGTIEI